MLGAAGSISLCAGNSNRWLRYRFMSISANGIGHQQVLRDNWQKIPITLI